MYVYTPALEAAAPTGYVPFDPSNRTDESQWACCRHIKAIIIFDSA